jgi:hypothetical protein
MQMYYMKSYEINKIKKMEKKKMKIYIMPCASTRQTFCRLSAVCLRTA